MIQRKLSARILSLVLTVSMVVTMMPQAVLATEGDGALGTAATIECHKEHDATCGYKEAVKGTPAEEEIPCDKACKGEHSAECAYKPAVAEILAVEAVPCTHTCEKCKTVANSDANKDASSDANKGANSDANKGADSDAGKVANKVAAPAPRAAGGILITGVIDLSSAAADTSCVKDHTHTHAAGEECWAWNNTTKVLTLNNLDLTSTTGAIIMPDVDSTIQVNGTNNVVGAETMVIGFDNYTLTITGEGTLNVSGTATSGIFSNETNGNLVIEKCTLNVSGTNEGISMNGGSVTINSGTVTAKSLSDSYGYCRGIYASNIITINGGNVTASSHIDSKFGRGICAPQGITINDGTGTASGNQGFNRQPAGTLGAKLSGWDASSVTWPAPELSFDARNGVDIPAAVIAGGKITMPDTPKWGNYTFAGWYTDIDGVGKAFENKDLTVDTTVYAKWTKDGKTVRTTSLDLTGEVTPAPEQGWTWDSGTKTLSLNGANIVKRDAPAPLQGDTGTMFSYGILLPMLSTICLVDGSTNSIRGGDLDKNNVEGKSALSVGIYAPVDSTITINGNGILNVASGVSNLDGISKEVHNSGIYAKDVVINKGVTVNTFGGDGNSSGSVYSYGIECRNLTMTDAVLNATAGDTVLTGSGYKGYVENNAIYGKALTMSGSAITAFPGTVSGTLQKQEGLYMSEGITITGGSITAKGSNSAVKCGSAGFINAVDAIVTGANEEFVSGATAELTQKEQATPVVIGFAKTISFDARNGESIADAKAGADGTITMPNTPKWGEYTFAGWYTDIDGVGKAFENKDLTVDTTVYAKWTKGGKTVRTTSLDLTGEVTPAPEQGWTWDSGTKTLSLNGANIKGEGSVGSTGLSSIELYAVKLPSGATINLAEGSESSVTAGNCIGSDAADISSYGISVDDRTASKTLTMQGKGTLNAAGGDISNKEAGDSTGIFSTDTINIISGTVNATGGTVESKGDSPQSMSYGICADEDAAITIGEDAAVTATGGNATSTSTRGTYSMAASVGISSLIEIASNCGALTAVGGKASCYDVTGKPIPDYQNSFGLMSEIITFSSPAVISAKGERSAVYSITSITADGATVTGAAEDFISGTTTELTQKDQATPVVISFGPSIAVAAQSGTATYGMAASPTFAITNSSFGDIYPAFAPSIVWTNGSAPTGVTAAFADSNAKLNINTTAATPAGEYKFKVVSAKNPSTNGNYESAEATLKVDKLEATITWNDTTSFTYNGSAQAPTATVGNKVGSDVVTVSVTDGQVNAGSHTATANALAGASADNYKLPAIAPTQAFTITAKTVTVTNGTLEVKKPHDSKTDAGTATGKLGLTGVVAADTDNVSVNVDTVGVYANADIGKNKTVELTISLEGSAKDNYALSSNSYSFTAAEITKVAYNGTPATAPNSAPTSKSDKSITIAAVTPPTDEDVEYAVSKTDTAPTSDKDWQATTTFDNLDPNTEYFFFARVKENDKHAPGGVSASTAITTDKSEYTTKPTKPDGTPDSKSDISITLKTATPPDGEALEYGIDKNNDGTITWQDTPTFSTLSPNTEYKFYTRVKENDKHKAGSASDATAIKTAKAPYNSTEAIAPGNANKTDTSVTLAPQTVVNETVEYGIKNSDGTIKWQDSNTFTGLAANTDYDFFARVKENDTHAAGATSVSTTIKTDKVAYTGTQPTAPNRIPDNKTDTSITIKTVTPPEGETVEYGIDKDNNGTITWQDTPTFSSLSPNTEYKFYTRVKENDKHKAGAASAATAITTKPAPATVSGVVKDSDGSNLDKAVIQLKQGDTVIKNATTISNGQYILNDVPAGVYNLVVTKGTAPNTVVITQMITVAGIAITDQNVQFESGNKNTIVESTPGAPKVAVGGMNDLLNTANIGTTLTIAEKAAVDASGSVEMKFAADIKTASDVTTDKSKIESIATGKKIDLLLDLSVLKTVKNSVGTIITNGIKVTTLADLIEVYLPIPENLQGKAGLSLYRVHNGAAQALSTAPDSNGEYYIIDPSGEFMTLHIKNFSTYALGYSAFTVTLSGGGDGATGAGNYSNGDVVTINAGSKNGHTFNGWTVTAGSAILANPSSASTTFTMPSGNVTVTANWKANASGGNGNSGGSSTTYFYITATAGPGGSLSTPEIVKVRPGESAGFTIIPDKGYQIKDVLVNGKSIGAKNYYAFANVLSNQTIHVTFKKGGHSNPQTGIF